MDLASFHSNQDAEERGGHEGILVDFGYAQDVARKESILQAMISRHFATCFHPVNGFPNSHMASGQRRTLYLRQL